MTSGRDGLRDRVQLFRSAFPVIHEAFSAFDSGDMLHQLGAEE